MRCGSLGESDDAVAMLAVVQSLSLPQGTSLAASRNMARRKLTEWEIRSQPINWGRAIVSGIIAASLLMAFTDVFYLLGFSGFSFEMYLGSLIRGRPSGSHVWTLGLIANWVVGAVISLVYAYFFEYVFKRANTRIGVIVGFAHAIIAAVALFPFFGMLHAQIGSGGAIGFGFFGSGYDATTPIILLFAHLLFGACMGLFYGAVREVRMTSRTWEPGEMGRPGDPGIITSAEDPSDAAYV